MFFTATYSGQWIDVGVTQTATMYFVFPPGFDCQLASLPTVTLNKANTAQTYAANTVTQIGAGGLVSLAQPQGLAWVVTASGSGSPTVDCKVLPSTFFAYLATPGGSSNTLTVDGSPSETINALASSAVPFDPASASPVFAGMDPGGAISYYTDAPTAVSAKQIVWYAGLNRNSGADPTPTSVHLQECVERDHILATGSLPAFPATGIIQFIRATGTVYPGFELFTSQDGSAVAINSGHTRPIALGTCISVDRSQSPPQIGYVPKAFSRILTQSRGLQLAARIAPKRAFVNFSTSFTTGSGAQIAYDLDYGKLAYVCLARIATSWTSAGSSSRSIPLTFSDILCPAMTGCPDFAIDVTLPAPFGACRIVWTSGMPTLCQQTDPVTAPSGMVRQLSVRPVGEQNRGEAVWTRFGFSALRNLDGWGDSPYPTGIYPGLPGSGNSNGNYGPSPTGHGIRAAPVRIADIPDLHLYRAMPRVGPSYATNQRGFAQWVRLDAVGCPVPSATANDGQVTCSAIQSIPYSNIGGALDSGLIEADITIKPTGGPEEIGCFALRTWLLVDALGGAGPYDILFVEEFSQPNPRGFWAARIDVQNEFNPAPYMTELVSGGSCRKVIWPIDVLRWQPFPNDANCSYVGNTGWAYGSPPRTATYGITGGFSVSWASNQYTVSALPTPTTAPAIGAQYVRSTGTIPVSWAFRAKAPTLHRRYGYLYSATTLPTNISDYAWFDDSVGERMMPSSSAMPRNIPAANPGAVATDTTVELALLASFWTDWGNSAQYVPPITRQTVTLT